MNGKTRLRAKNAPPLKSMPIESNNSLGKIAAVKAAVAEAANQARRNHAILKNRYRKMIFLSNTPGLWVAEMRTAHKENVI